MTLKADNPTGEYLSTMTRRRPIYSNGRYRTPFNFWRALHMVSVVFALIAIFAIGLNL